MKRSEIGTLRLANQRVSAHKAKSLQAVAAWMGALQGQDLSAVKRAVALRTQGALTEADVDKALARGEVVRAWSMRGTIQLVPPQDARWMAELASARVVASASTVERSLGLDDAVIAKAAKVIAKALKGGKVLERPALYEELESKGISTKWQRGYHILFRGGLTGLICFGPRSDKQPTFVLMAEWAPAAKSMPREAAVAELARRYFRSHGPATLQDFAWWTGLSLTECKKALVAIRGEMREENVDGESYWLYENDIAAPKDGCYLLPGFDEFVLGYKDRSAVISPDLAPALSPHKNGIFLPTMASKGRIVGTWARTLDKKGVTIEARPFAALGAKEQRGFKAEAENYAEYLGVKLVKLSL